MLNTRIKKVVSMFLCLSLLCLSFVSAYAQAQTPKDNKSQTLSKSTIALVDKYVSVKDGRYILSLPKDIQKKLSSEELKAVKESIAQANNFLKQSKVKFKNSGKTFALSIPNSKMNASFTDSGETKLEVHWWGVNLFMSSTVVREVAIGESAAAGVLAAFIPDLGKEAIAVIAASFSAIIKDLMTNQEYCPIVLQIKWSAFLLMGGAAYGRDFFAWPQYPDWDYSTWLLD